MQVTSSPHSDAHASRGPSPGSPALLLFPTDLEHRRFLDLGGMAAGFALVRICGFGPVAAAARTAQLIARLRPRHVFLVGIAGSYDSARHAVGEAFAFNQVTVEGIGAGSGTTLRGPSKLGFPQWPGSLDTTTDAIEETIDLSVPSGAGDGLLLTTCAASDSPEHAAERRARHPDAIAEDMEGFAVAMACAMARVPITIVRGISNVVGDRDPANWRIPAALGAARRRVIDLFEQTRP